MAHFDLETLYNTDQLKRFYFPGRILLGPRVSCYAVSLLEGVPSIAVVVDVAFAGSSVFLDTIKALEGSRIQSLVVKGMPVAEEAVEFGRRLGSVPAAILSIGGGSAADTAKATMASLLFGHIDGVGLGANRGEKPAGPKPLFVAVPTTGDSGAEASRYYVTYARATRAKVHGRSWTLVADWILLDPRMLAGMPVSALTTCAFDAFVHFFESFICKYERSTFGDMLSLHGMTTVMSAVHRVVRQGIRDDAVHADLLQAGTLGGMAISNIRTGSIHEAAGALLEHTNLAHGETLFVFFRQAVKQYRAHINDREALLVERLRSVPFLDQLGSIEDVIQWWEALFDATGLTARIRQAISDCRPEGARVKRHVFDRVFADKVWLSKESPVALSETMIRELTDESLRSFGMS